jgi:5-methylcytosine-specific restriction enzyme subunit McrC
MTVRERQKLPIGAGHLTEAEAAALARLTLPPGALVWEHRALRLGPFCGILRADDLVLEILPKITGAAGDDETRGVLVAMLRPAGHLAERPAGAAPLALQGLHLLDIFVLDFCERVNGLLRQGAIRTYEVHEEDLAALRGRLNLPAQLRRDRLDRARLHCRFDELSVDNPHNRALKAVLARLLGQSLGPEAKAAVNVLLRRMEEIAARPCSLRELTNLHFDRRTKMWRPVFEQAAWFLRGLYPDVRAGHADGPALLFDMERLFEAFVGAKLRARWREVGGLRVVLQGPQRHFATAGGTPVFRMRPDISVVVAGGTVACVYDTKWKSLDPGLANRGVAQADIYQIAGYAGRYGCDRTALLYPRGEGMAQGLVETFTIASPGAPRVDVYALDLPALARGVQLPMGLGPRVGDLEKPAGTGPAAP